MKEQAEHKRLLIMKILRESVHPLSSQKIRGQLQIYGLDISERTIRFHLQSLDEQGYTQYKEKKGRYLTSKGKAELSYAQVYDRVGFLSSKIDEMTYQMSFQPEKAKGTVLMNLSIIEKKYREEVEVLLPPVFSSGLAHGKLLALFDEGEKVGDRMIPAGKMGIGTVCSITYNACLIKAGIPVSSRFGGLLEIQQQEAKRFTAIIRYDGTSLDPLEIYISGRMTSTSQAAHEGAGLIGVGFREIPASARQEAIEVDELLKTRGLGGFLKLGYPGQALLDIPLGDNRIGMVLNGGLNAVAPLVEKGLSLDSKALSSLVDYSSLFFYGELGARIARLK